MNKNYRLLTIFAKKSPSQMFDSDTKYISEISTSFARIATCNFKIRRINYRCFSVRLTKVFKQLFCRTPVNTIVGTAWKVSVSGFSLVRIFPHKEYLHVFSPNAENTDQKNFEYGHFHAVTLRSGPLQLCIYAIHFI